MINPYIVGPPAKGDDFYGRQDLLDELLDKRRTWVYLLGNRRSGKTSTLFKLEVETKEIGIYFSLQGAAGDKIEMARRLVEQVSAKAELEPFLNNISLNAELGLVEVIRSLAASAHCAGKEIILLVDEAEELLKLDDLTLQRLHGAFQNSKNLRVILAATKELSLMYERCRAWKTSSFLQSFFIAVLSPFEVEEASNLVRMVKNEIPVSVTPDVVEKILEATGSQPYLIQHLCYRLFKKGELRTPVKADYKSDMLLKDWLQSDYGNLSPSEQKILHILAERQPLDIKAILDTLTLPQNNLEQHLEGMEQLGLVIEKEGFYRLSNFYLLTWLKTGVEQSEEIKITDQQSLGPTQPPAVEEAPVRNRSSRILAAKNRYALLVGVDQYIQPGIPALFYCSEDVLAVQDKLTQLGYCVVSLHSKSQDPAFQPDRNVILEHMERVCKSASRQDLVWIYVASHGRQINGQPVLLARDSGLQSLDETGIWVSKVEQVLRRCKANQKVLTLDVCSSGSDLERDIPDQDFIHQVYDLSAGFALLSASTARQKAQEWHEKKHGVFTYFMLEGLAGNAKRTGQDFVTVRDLSEYTLCQLRKWALEGNHLLQEPTCRWDGMGDIILADYRQAGGSEGK